MGRYHADLQPAVGGGEEEWGDVVGVSVLQQPLSEPGLIPAKREDLIHVKTSQTLKTFCSHWVTVTI